MITADTYRKIFEIFHSHRWATVWEFSIAHPIFHLPWATGQVGVFIPALYLKVFIQNLVQNGSVVSEKIRFEFLYVHDLGSRSRNDLDLQYSHTFINSFSYLYLPTFRSQASIVSEKLTVFTFSYRKA